MITNNDLKVFRQSYIDENEEQKRQQYIEWTKADIDVTNVPYSNYYTLIKTLADRAKRPDPTEPIKPIEPWKNFEPLPINEWHDIKAILAADQRNYAAKCITLVPAVAATITSANPFATSDGAFYPNGGDVHTWALNHGKQAYDDKGVPIYKTRYIIEYSVNDLEAVVNLQRHALYAIIDGFMISNSSFNGRRLFRGFDVLDNHYGWATTTGNGLFSGCANMITSAAIDYSVLTSHASMYANATALINTPPIDLINSSSIANICDGCKNLQSYDFKNAGGVLNMSSAFRGAGIQVVQPLDTSGCNTFTSMHANNTRLQKTYDYDFSSALGLSSMYFNTPLLTGEITVNAVLATLVTNMFEQSGINKVTGDLQSATSLYRMFANSKVEIINITNAPNVANMSYFCDHATELLKVTVKKLIKATDSSYAFSWCSKLNDTTLTETINLLNNEHMFEYNLSMIKSPFFITTKVKNVDYKFSHNANMVELAMYDYGNVIQMNYVCEYCDYLTIIPLWNLTKVQTAIGSFQFCLHNEGYPLFSFDSIIDFTQFSQESPQVRSFPEWSLKTAERVSYAYYNCIGVERLGELDIINAYDTDSMCGNMLLLETVKGITPAKAQAQHNIFYNCVGLVDIKVHGLATDETMNASENLSQESIVFAYKNRNMSTGRINFRIGASALKNITAAEKAEALSVYNVAIS